MSIVLPLFVAFVLGHIAVLAVDLSPYIIGGEEISTLYVPFQVSLRRRSNEASAYAHTCGGSVIDGHTVVTAAHCVRNRVATDFLIVAGGEYRNGMDGIVVRIEEIVIHELYNASITDNDIALLFVTPSFPLTNEKIDAIELAQSVPAAGTFATVSGWGATTENGAFSTRLHQTEVPVVATDECQQTYNWRPITDGMLCAGHSMGGRDACQGDSGGPLVINNQLVGIVSWGEGCARPDYPGVYTNVAHYLEWIAEKREAFVTK